MRSILTLVVALLVCGVARAEDREAARQAFRSGSQHYKLGEYKEALADFKLAFRNYEDPSFLYNIAQCERQLGMREDAVREYRMYLSETPNAPNTDDVRTMISKLEHEIAEQKTAAAPAPAKTATTTSPVPADALVAAPSPKPVKPTTPAYKKWWVWTVVGAVAAGGAAGLAVGLTRSGAAPTANTTLGTTKPLFN
jgi:tetratricopeptide (TPR) repeat protein